MAVSMMLKNASFFLLTILAMVHLVHLEESPVPDFGKMSFEEVTDTWHFKKCEFPSATFYESTNEEQPAYFESCRPSWGNSNDPGQKVCVEFVSMTFDLCFKKNPYWRYILPELTEERIEWAIQQLKARDLCQTILTLDEKSKAYAPSLTKEEEDCKMLCRHDSPLRPFCLLDAAVMCQAAGNSQCGLEPLKERDEEKEPADKKEEDDFKNVATSTEKYEWDTTTSDKEGKDEANTDTQGSEGAGKSNDGASGEKASEKKDGDKNEENEKEKGAAKKKKKKGDAKQKEEKGDAKKNEEKEEAKKKGDKGDATEETQPDENGKTQKQNTASVLNPDNYEGGNTLLFAVCLLIVLLIGFFIYTYGSQIKACCLDSDAKSERPRPKSKGKGVKYSKLTKGEDALADVENPDNKNYIY